MTEPYSRLRSDPKTRFALYINKQGPEPEIDPGLGACWEWTRSKFKSGYGCFHPRHGETTLAHRYSYELLVGPIPSGLHLDHLCRNRSCVNPAHLEPVTNEENLSRGWGYRLRNGMDNRCVNGHEYTSETTYRNPNNPNDARCLICSRQRDRKRALDGK